MTWREQAACRDADMNIFFVNGHSTARGRALEAGAKRICAGCPVRANCLQSALDLTDAGECVVGIWGGFKFDKRGHVSPEARSQPAVG